MLPYHRTCMYTYDIHFAEIIIEFLSFKFAQIPYKNSRTNVHVKKLRLYWAVGKYILLKRKF